MRKLSRRRFVKALGLGAAAVAAPRLTAARAAAKRKPNVVFILADDLGWRDTALYGSRFYETPNIDRLAKRGMLFTQAYAANPLCSPTRASIMNSLTRLRREYFTLAEAFKQAGYATGHFGKWHLGREPYDPLHQGFDVDFPHWPGPGPAGSYLAPWRFPKLKGAPGEHIEDRVAAEAVKFIRASSDRPFFLSYWCFSVHAPYDAKAKLIEKYRRKADPKCPQRHPVMGAMIQSLDENVGRVVRTIDELGLTDNTIILFFSDNGGVHWPGNRGQGNAYGNTPITSNSPLRGGKATIYEGGTREPLLVVWPGAVEPGSRSDQLVSSIDFYPTLLEMAALRPKRQQHFDGISIVAALKGKPLGRDTVFCHFPHYVRATGNLPATYVRKGDWKLIRFYADNADQTDRFELYNLAADIGESKDLAGAMPQKVKELNALIDRHLRETGAVAAVPNPRYDPRALVTVEGWRAGGTCSLAVKGGVLEVTSTGGDPYLHTGDVPKADGPVTFGVRMKCRTRGPGQVFWTTTRDPRFHRSRSVAMPLRHDGAWHVYEVKLPVRGRLRALRIDPGTAPGKIEIDWVRIARPNAAVLKRWDFEGKRK